METTVYSNGVLMKTAYPDGKMVSLIDECISSYSFSGDGSEETSIKLNKDGSRGLKTYNTTPSARDTALEYVSSVNDDVIGVGRIGDTVEVYYGIRDTSAIKSLADEFGLDVPFDLSVVDESWGIDFRSSSTRMLGFGEKVIVVSIKFKDDIPLLMKLYRGNYIPNQEEVADAEAYWAANPI